MAVLAVAGSSTPITAGGVKLTAASGKVTIKLMNQALRVAAGRKLTLYLGSTSLVQSTANALYLAAVQPDARITIGRVTLKTICRASSEDPSATTITLGKTSSG